MAPEVKLNRPVTLKADIYSLGMLFGWMRYQTIDFRFRLTKDLNLRDPIAELINKMTMMDAANRVDIDAVVQQLAQPVNPTHNKSARVLTSVYSKPNEQEARSLTPTGAAKLTTLTTLRNRNPGEDRSREGLELKSKSITKGGISAEGISKAHANKLLKERVQYNYILVVASEIAADGASKARLLLFLLAKKAKLVAARCRLVLA